MSAMVQPVIGRVAAAFRDLRAALDESGVAGDRRIALDAVRDALDRDANAMAPSGIDQPCMIAGTWSVEGEVHRGAFFVVLKLRQRDLGTFHALKTMAPAQAGDPDLRALLLREASRQMRICHPAILAVQAVLRLDDGRPAILSAYHEAPTLAAMLGESRLTEPQILALALRLTGALVAVQEAGLVHGDIAPANILMPGRDPARAILCDFGLAQPLGTARRDDEFSEAGTPGYMAPEQGGIGAVLDARTDLFGLGAVLRACHACESVARPSPRLEMLCAALSTRDPAHRPRDAADVLQTLIEAERRPGEAPC